MQSFKILFVVTSADRMGNAPDPTGSWLEEIAAPYYTFRDAKCHVTLASPKGGAAPLDPKSFEEQYQSASTRRWNADSTAQAALASTSKLSALKADEYDAIFFAGGHGTMEDFPKDESVKAVIEQMYAAGKPVSAVCHGPACLVHCVKPTGEPLVKGHRFTCFTNEEETLVGLEKIVPFLLESKLSDQGGIAVPYAAFKGNVMVDENLITGQNPASAIPVAESVIHQLRTMMRLAAAA